MHSSHCCSISKEVTLISLSFIVCVLAIDSFLFPILPNVRQYAFRSPSSDSGESGSLHGLDRSGSLLSGALKESAVLYRNASWKPEIGHWLSHFGAAPLTSISERFPSNKCDNNCGGRGVCNHDLAECRCFHGYSGKGCELEEDFPCKKSESIWRPSICGAACDKRKAFCYCGEGTKYPHRPVPAACGFVWKGEKVDWFKPDVGIFSNSSDKSGWCNRDHDDFTRPLKRDCQCKYDGMAGAFCDEPVESVCINQCSGNGQCRGGFCSCAEGWYGIDCSIPLSLQSLSLDRWPSWLLGSTINITSSDLQETETLKLISVGKPRPLIYVYDLPAEFNSHLLEGRLFRAWCSTRTYYDQNRTVWLADLYGSEPSLLESLLASPHRTTNAEEADFFYVPTFEACARYQADSAPHTDMQANYLGLRSFYAGDFHKRAYQHIKKNYPYWNRSDGRDHIWLFAWDEGACSAPKEIWNSIMLVHWGNTHSKHNYSTSAYPPDRWNRIPTGWRGNHPCYDPAKDIVIPAWKRPDPDITTQKLWARPRDERPTLFYFNGNLGNMYELGRPEKEYSMGLRQKLGEEFGSIANKNGQLGRQWSPDVTVTTAKTRDYGLELSRSRFCGVFPGDGWSGRMEDSILHGCIPVIVQDGIHLPYENVLDYNAFTVRVAENDLANMVHILRGINDTTVDSMLSAVQRMWQRFTYHNAVKLEAQRQKLKFEYAAQWATEYNKLNDDDAFATLMQVLAFKLSNRQREINSSEVTMDTSYARGHGGNK